jgi:hypothetical protein
MAKQADETEIGPKYIDHARPALSSSVLDVTTNTNTDTEKVEELDVKLVEPPPDGGAVAWIQVFCSHLVREREPFGIHEYPSIPN